MNPGKLDRRIEIHGPTVSVSAESGGAEERFALVATVWAAKADAGGREYRAAGALNAEASTLFTIRFRADITPRHRIVCEGQTYDILGIGEASGARRAFLNVQARVRLP
jgi:SPP1 family predicted phage head-tail adaptor